MDIDPNINYSIHINLVILGMLIHIIEKLDQHKDKLTLNMMERIIVFKGHQTVLKDKDWYILLT